MNQRNNQFLNQSTGSKSTTNSTLGMLICLILGYNQYTYKCVVTQLPSQVCTSTICFRTNVWKYQQYRIPDNLCWFHTFFKIKQFPANKLALTWRNWLTGSPHPLPRLFTITPRRWSSAFTVKWEIRARGSYKVAIWLNIILLERNLGILCYNSFLTKSGPDFTFLNHFKNSNLY